MPIKVGGRVPTATFKQLSVNGIANIDTETLLTEKKVILFGLPGAHTPVCSANRPFVDEYDETEGRGHV
jgi:glutaredoxin/glutathione-dependent peroxiredoxin